MGSGVTVLTAAILAGGQARRLGGVDKSALTVGTNAILARQLALLRRITPHVLVVANDPRIGRGVDGMDGVTVVGDRIEGVGALGGLYTALVEARTTHVLVVACDMPFLTEPFLMRLVELGAGCDVALPRDRAGRHPLCGSFAARIAPHLKACIDARRLRIADALDGLSVREMGPDDLAGFDPDGRLLINVNTPDDYARAQAVATMADGQP